MNAFRHKLKWPLLLSLLLVVASCDDNFDEINTDPTKFTDIDEGFQFAWVINRMVAERFEQWRGNMIYNSEWAQHFAGTWGPDLYDVSDDVFLSAQWDKTYVDYLKNMNDVIARTDENSNKNLIARVMRYGKRGEIRVSPSSRVANFTSGDAFFRFIIILSLCQIMRDYSTASDCGWTK